MGRRLVETAPVQPLAYRGAEAAAALGVSIDYFKANIAHQIPCVRAGGDVVLYPVAELAAWLQRNAHATADDLAPRRRKAA